MSSEAAAGPDRWAIATVVLVGLVGAYDVAIGLFMLLAADPSLAHGADTVWTSVAASDGTMSLFRRMGAFSLHAGVVTLVWAATSLRRPAAMTALLATYCVTGIAFAATDARYFADTPYQAMKGVIGGVFVLAVVLHAAGRARARRSR